MPALEPADTDLRSDADVISAIREGDTDAIDELYRRHHRAALSFAESIAGHTLAPDLVSDAFLRIFDLLQRGGGPTLVFRSYLYTTVRNLHIDHIRHHSRQTSMPDFSPIEAELAVGDGLDDRFEHSLVKQAFSSLPQRWQVALWYTTVEGVSLEDAGTYLGVAPNAVAALTFRAREGLRQAYLAEHLNLTAEQDCAAVWEVLPKYVRGGLRPRMRETVEEHLPGCRSCTTAVLELGEVNSNLRGVLLIALVGTGMAGALDAALGPVTVTPTVASASSGPFGMSSLGRIAAVVGTAAAAGVMVVAWPHHDDLSRTTSPRAQGPGISRATQVNPHTSPPATAGEPATPRVVRTGVQSVVHQVSATRPGVTLGAPTWSRLTTSTPSWFHVGVPITAPGARAGDLTLVISASSWSAYHVHREDGYGAWECTSAGATGLRCRLPADVATLDLGFDVQTPARITLKVSVTRAGEAPVTTEVVVG
ncbi:MAG: sigma-70 family RNA polymerase sigma factor [Marmoricola sp.]